MPHNRRRNERVQFEFGYGARIMAIDATWQRGRVIAGISRSEARQVIHRSIEGRATAEFLLVLSRGGAHRRCKTAWISGDETGVSFEQELSVASDRVGRRRWAEDARPKS